jgi:hypothetical protein
MKRFDCGMMAEEYIHTQFDLTSNILKELEYAETKTIKPLYNYQLTTLKENFEVANDVVRDYRTGLNDPSRDVAKMENSLFLKK